MKNPTRIRHSSLSINGDLEILAGGTLILGDDVLSAAEGGLGLSSYTIGDLIYASGIATLAKLADIATGNVLLSGGVGAAPSWGKVVLSTHVSGTLPAANGGTGSSSYTVGDLLYASAATTLAKLLDVATGSYLASGGVGVAPAWATLNQAAVAGLTTASSPTFAGLNLPSGAIITWDTNDVTLTHSADALTLAGGQLVVPDGTVGAPALSFASLGPTGGFFNDSGDSGINLAFLGIKRYAFDSNQLELRADNFTLTLGINNTIVLTNEATAILQMGADAAAPVAQTFKGADARAGTDTDAVGGVMRLASGRSTGNAVPGVLSLQGTAASVTTGTGAQTLIDRFIPNAFKVLTDASAIAILNVTVANATATGGKIVYQIEVTDGTDYQSEVGEVFFNTQNDGAAVVGAITEVNSQQAISAGGSTLATTWAMTDANPAVISINANSSLVPSTGYPRITFSVQNLGQQAVAIQ